MTHARAQVIGYLAGGPAWGYRLSEETGLGPGTLYPILHSFERMGLVEAEEQDHLGSDGRALRRKYYRLTTTGASLVASAHTKLAGLERSAWSPP